MISYEELSEVNIYGRRSGSGGSEGAAGGQVKGSSCGRREVERNLQLSAVLFFQETAKALFNMAGIVLVVMMSLKSVIVALSGALDFAFQSERCECNACAYQAGATGQQCTNSSSANIIPISQENGTSSSSQACSTLPPSSISRAASNSSAQTTVTNTAVMPAEAAAPSKVGASKEKAQMSLEDAIDCDSVRGVFGWTTLDGVNVPYIIRKYRKFVAVRIVEKKMLSKYPNSFPDELGKKEPLVSYFVTEAEANLLNEINTVHCSFEYGHQPFTTKDLIVDLVEFEEFYNLVKKTFPEDVLASMTGDGDEAGVDEKKRQLSKLCGWMQINNTRTCCSCAFATAGQNVEAVVPVPQAVHMNTANHNRDRAVPVHMNTVSHIRDAVVPVELNPACQDAATRLADPHKTASPQSRPKTTATSDGHLKLVADITAVLVHNKSISCLVRNSPERRGKFCLVEAVSKLYFPHCKLGEFVHALQNVLKLDLPFVL
ncbi:hypothetical protein BaRGS_00009027 [Batillaria attramentaria]|uniref:Uncharacterized protein n=1 Tax=Batillaria attramentaria TaxID=370345 RepID=A0ABD0LK71_9CAEN